MGIYRLSYLRGGEVEKFKEGNAIFLGEYQADLTNVYMSLFGHDDSLLPYLEIPSWVF